MSSKHHPMAIRLRVSEVVAMAVTLSLLLALPPVAGLEAAVARRYTLNEDPEEEILAIGYSGGYGPSEARSFVLFGDGRLVRRVASARVGAPPEVKDSVELVLSRDEVRALVDMVVDAGLVEFAPGDTDKRLGPRRPLVIDAATLWLNVSLGSYDGPTRKEAGPFEHATEIYAASHAIRFYRKEKLSGRIAAAEPDTFVEAEALVRLHGHLAHLVDASQ